MNFDNRIVVVTGGASGIGEGLAREACSRGASKVIITDLNEGQGQKVADELGGAFYRLDVSDADAVADTVRSVEAEHGPVGTWFSNAGILFTDAPTFDCFAQSADQWDRIWQVNVHAHVHAARALVPLFRSRGGGQFVITASAAGLLSQIGDAAYSTTKHAAVGFAESMAIAHGDEGIEVAVLCPQAVDTPMIAGAGEVSAALDGVLSVAEMARRSFDQMAEGRFMIRPHGEVEEYFNMKAGDYDRWVGGMRKLRRSQLQKTGKPI